MTNFDKTRAWIELNLEALQHNVSTLQRFLPHGCMLMPTVKANAYGHGAVPITRALNQLGIQAFCVATLAEGMELRQAGITGDILILGYTHPSQFALLSQFDLTQTVVDFPYAQQMNQSGCTLNVHIAVDTGMHRIGEPYGHFEKIRSIFSMERLRVTGIYTHLCADDRESAGDCAFTAQQAAAFRHLLFRLQACGLQPPAHLLSSHSLFTAPELGGDYARVGMALYGMLGTPADTDRCPADLRPVLSLKARVASVRQVYPGERVGYSPAYVAQRNLRIAAFAIGYGDGLPRALSCGAGSVLIHGCKAPILGQICMDQTLVDISDIPDVRPGDIATLVGTDGSLALRACDLAAQANTIANEFLCRLGSRLPRLVLPTIRRRPLRHAAVAARSP